MQRANPGLPGSGRAVPRLMAALLSLVVLAATGLNAAHHGHQGTLDGSQACAVCHVSHQPPAVASSFPVVPVEAFRDRSDERPPSVRPVSGAIAASPDARAPPRGS